MSATPGPLIRPRSNRVFGGVCAAVARRFGWDVALVRVLTVVAALLTGAALIVYLVLWVVVPSE
ncbi:PspC domain-containing protein [Protaetiibacter larvae]|uniref:PspC domain-containing protein n=1 Tax=Protaetiibacter larvae TaxID=2592654 RepID=A0A5C1Y9F0_9MICO|nr:PspC domain-containing protein [Protaetiibacter larvae]QEO10511.1 PspC domain-containing protein [Protaetiibacter larvae]